MREEGKRLEAVVAGLASPEIGHAARFGLNPFRNGDRFAALGAGISPGQGAEVDSGHGVSPFYFRLIFFSSDDELDSIAVGYQGSDVRVFERAMSQFDGKERVKDILEVLTMHLGAGTKAAAAPDRLRTTPKSSAVRSILATQQRFTYFAFGSTTGSIVCIAPTLRTWIVATSSAYTFCQPSR
jgi:hypothetical protein